MKKITLNLLLCLPAFAWAQGKPFTLTGHFPAHKETTYLMINYTTDQKNIHDSVKVVNGNFQYTGQKVENDPILIYLALMHSGPVQNGRYDALEVFVDSTKIAIEGSDSLRYAQVVKSRLNQDYKDFNRAIAPFRDSVIALRALFNAAPKPRQNDSLFQDSINQKIGRLMAAGGDVQHRFITRHNDSFLSLLLLSQSARDSTSIKAAVPVYGNFTKRVRNTDTGRDFEKLVNSIKITAVGMPAPDFTQPDLNGRPVKLSSLRGKYVLLDFWASWCAPCRAENPNVVRAYQQFKNKNFTVLSVSLDFPGKKEAWMSAAKADHLTWTQVSDLKGWQNSVVKLYGINAIPQNYLIDPSGKIVAANLRGDDLNKKLQEIFK